MTSRVPASLFALRAMGERDHAFVFKSWLTSYAQAPLCRMLASERWAFFSGHHRIVERVLARGEGVVAHPPGDADTILAWLVYEPETVHYVFVKGPFRGNGLGRTLIRSALGDDCEAARVTYTHKSPDLLRLTRNVETTDDAEPPKLTIPAPWVHCFYAVDGPVRRYDDSRKEEIVAA